MDEVIAALRQVLEEARAKLDADPAAVAAVEEALGIDPSALDARSVQEALTAARGLLGGDGAGLERLASALEAGGLPGDGLRGLPAWLSAAGQDPEALADLMRRSAKAIDGDEAHDPELIAEELRQLAAPLVEAEEAADRARIRRDVRSSVASAMRGFSLPPLSQAKKD